MIVQAQSPSTVATSSSNQLASSDQLNRKSEVDVLQKQLAATRSLLKEAIAALEDEKAQRIVAEQDASYYESSLDDHLEYYSNHCQRLYSQIDTERMANGRVAIYNDGRVSNIIDDGNT